MKEDLACPLCKSNYGFSESGLKTHLQRTHHVDKDKVNALLEGRIKVCPKCGRKIKKSEEFCENCTMLVNNYERMKEKILNSAKHVRTHLKKMEDLVKRFEYGNGYLDIT